jgi:transcriptional regulator with PAS, ATPase and Fis domain
MIFIPRFLLLLFALIAGAAITLLGLAGYFNFSQQSVYTALQAKLTAEWFLFGALLSLLLLGIIMARIIVVRRRVSHELQRIHTMSSYISLSSQLNSKRLYELGPPLAELFKRVTSINEKQSLKMSAQHALNSFLCANIAAALLVSDSTGKIVHVSIRYEEEDKTERTKLLDKNIENLIPNLFMHEVIANIEKQQLYKKEKKDDRSFRVYPIYNHSAQITYFVFDVGGTTDFAYTSGTGPHSTTLARKEENFSNSISNRLSGRLKNFSKYINRSK